MANLQAYHKTEYGYFSQEIDSLMSLDSMSLARYQYRVVYADSHNFVLEAREIFDFDQDGQLRIWQMDTSKNCKEIKL
ncbi:MAG: hypothetical protein AAFW00_23490 [Bacteroidota bacterium]